MLLATLLRAQDCPAVARVSPSGTLAGALGASSCMLNDGSSYVSYRLDLPVRGKIAIELSGTSGDLQMILRDESGTRLEVGSSIRRPIEAGSYRVLVNGKTAGAGGSFTLTTAFAAEPSMLCANFPKVGQRQTITNTLGDYGCTAPDGTPYDGWSLTTFGGGTLTATIASQEFTPTLVLRGSDGRALATSVDGTLVAPLQGDTQYSIVVASADTNGVYQLTTAFENADDDVCRAVRTFSGAADDSGSINADSCYGEQQYYNHYNVTLESAGVATFTLTSGDFIPALVLLDEAGNTLALERDSLQVALPAGKYVLQVFSSVASGGAYQLQYAFKADALSPCTATPATLGDVQTGAFSAASCRTALGLSDLYTYTLEVPGTLELDLGSTDSPAILAIRDLKDNLIVRSDEHIAADLPAGVYSVVASARSSSSAYRLTSKFIAHDVPACGFTQSIDLNGGYIQRLNAASCKGPDGRPVDYYGFTLSADSLVLGVVTSSEVDGYLTLLDSGRNPLRTDDNSYGGIDPLIVQYLPAGSYRLAVRNADANTGGLYQVDLRTVEGPRPAFCSARGTLSLGATLEGNISYTGCQYRGETFADLYQFTLSADITVDLRLNSSEFDSHLVLLDAKGNVVDEDDNGGGNTNARIAAPLSAGTYYVVAKPFGDYLKHGAYTLSVQEAEATVPPK